MANGDNRDEHVCLYAATMNAQTIKDINENADVEDEHQSGPASIDSETEEIDELEDTEMDKNGDDLGKYAD